MILFSINLSIYKQKHINIYIQTYFCFFLFTCYVGLIDLNSLGIVSFQFHDQHVFNFKDLFYSLYC